MQQHTHDRFLSRGCLQLGEITMRGRDLRAGIEECM